MAELKNIPLIVDSMVSRNKRLSANAKIFYFSLIESCHPNGLIIVKETLYPKLRKNQITRYLKQLESENLIKKASRSKIKEIVQSSNNGIGLGPMNCDWCKTSCYALHGHHYPKRKSEGGNKIVDICPNCHANFHYLEGITFEFVDKKYFEFAWEFIMAGD